MSSDEQYLIYQDQYVVRLKRGKQLAEPLRSEVGLFVGVVPHLFAETVAFDA
jgi:hypothetical protein